MVNFICQINCPALNEVNGSLAILETKHKNTIIV